MPLCNTTHTQSLSAPLSPLPLSYLIRSLYSHYVACLALVIRFCIKALLVRSTHLRLNISLEAVQMAYKLVALLLACLLVITGYANGEFLVTWNSYQKICLTWVQ
jgi:hypothetical protein